ncbi:MAG: type II secretion system F family protein, partial [Limnochordales bacterium]
VLRIPFVGELVSKVIFSRFARTLALLFTSGISMVESLASCEKIVGNVVVAQDIAKARAGVQRGEGLAEPLRRGAEAFPPMLVEMIAVGEETGGLDKVLEQVADFYDREVEQTLKGLTSVIEPVIMVILGGIIFVIVLSVFMPMFDLVNVIE